MKKNVKTYKIKKLNRRRNIVYTEKKKNFTELYMYRLAHLELLNSSLEIKEIIKKIKKVHTKYKKSLQYKKNIKFYDIKKNYNLKKYEKIYRKLVRKYLDECHFQKFLDKRGQTRIEYAKELCDIAIKKVEGNA